MNTAFSNVVAAVIAALQAEPPVCTTLYRARTRDVPEQTDEAVNVQFEAAMPQMGSIQGAPIDWVSRVSVECYVRSKRDSGDIAVDPLFKKVYERIGQDSTLGGLVDDIAIQSIEAENSAEGTKTGWVRLMYMVQHRTSNQTLD